MMNALAVLCLLFCILYGASSAETERVVQDLSKVKQPSIGLGRKLGAVAADNLSALVSNSNAANKGTCNITDRLEPGFARQGAAFRRTTALDAAECALYCEFVAPSCVAINYRDSDSACFFLADPGYIYVALGHTTALVRPSLSSVCNSANMIIGHDRLGQDIPGNPHPVSSVTECCRLCHATPGCISYSVVARVSGCWLRKNVVPLNKNHAVVTGVVCLE